MKTVMTVQESIHSLMLQFSRLPQAERWQHLEDARQRVARAPNMKNAGVCWRGLSPEQLEAADGWARKAVR